MAPATVCVVRIFLWPARSFARIACVPDAWARIKVLLSSLGAGPKVLSPGLRARSWKRAVPSSIPGRVLLRNRKLKKIRRRTKCSKSSFTALTRKSQFQVARILLAFSAPARESQFLSTKVMLQLRLGNLQPARGDSLRMPWAHRIAKTTTVSATRTSRS